APHLLALATAVPKHELGQREVAQRARHVFGHAGVANLDRMVAVFGNAGIDTRYSTVPVDWYERPHGWAERNALYLEHALSLIDEAARKALAAADLDAEPRCDADGPAAAAQRFAAPAGLRPRLRRRRARPVACRRSRPRRAALAHPLPRRRAVRPVLSPRRFHQEQSRRDRPFRRRCGRGGDLLRRGRTGSGRGRR